METLTLNEAVGKKEKIVGNIQTLNYECPVCRSNYSWGQNKILKCNKCETVFIPYINQKIYDKAYTQKYIDYKESALNDELQKIRWENILKNAPKRYKNHLGDCDSLRLLDYGCGSGAFIEKAPELWDAWGTDINEHSIEYCWNNGLQTLELHDAFKATWDVVTMFDVLEHLPNMGVLNEIHSSLHKDGLLIIATPNLTKDTNLNEWRHFRPQGEHTFCFSKKSIEYLACLYGFTIIDINDNESTVRPPAGNISTYVLKKN